MTSVPNVPSGQERPRAGPPRQEQANERRHDRRDQDQPVRDRCRLEKRLLDRISGFEKSAAAHQMTSAMASVAGTRRSCTVAADEREHAQQRHDERATARKNRPSVGRTITSWRGWRGETCANQVTPSSTMSHCSQ